MRLSSPRPSDLTAVLARVARRGLLAAALAAGVVGAAGCNDIISHASESRETGIGLYNAGQYPEAAGAFQTVVKQRPQDYPSYYYLGRTYEAMKNYHAAVKEYRTSLKVMANSLAGPEDLEFRNKVLDGLASAVAAGNDISLEQTAFAPSPVPVTGEDHFVLAKVRRLQKDADSAIDEYQKAAAAEPDNRFIAKEQGLYLLGLNQRSKAADELKRAYVLNRRQKQPQDEQLESALRKTGVVPGPSLGDESDLARPLIPTGPLPEVKVGE